jgi:hypothetical protein
MDVRIDGRHRIVARGGDSAPMSWLGDLGSAFFRALYDFRAGALVAAVIGLALLGWVARRRHWTVAARRHPRRAAAIGLPLLAVTIPLAWYMTSPLVSSTTVDEPAPVAIASSAPSASVGPSAEPIGSPGPIDPPPLALRGTFHGSDDFHFGRGTARLIETAAGEYVVRLEDFAVRNGPDLYVYLSPDPAGYAKDAIELGRLKADRGNQNYAVPAGALDDPARAASVVIWCKQFSHLFATAPLSTI